MGHAAQEDVPLAGMVKSHALVVVAWYMGPQHLMMQVVSMDVLYLVVREVCFSAFTKESAYNINQ